MINYSKVVDSGQERSGMTMREKGRVVIVVMPEIFSPASMTTAFYKCPRTKTLRGKLYRFWIPD